MSRSEIRMEQNREQMLDTLISKYGFESEPVLYFTKWAWDNIHNMQIYFETAMNWHFWDE